LSKRKFVIVSIIIILIFSLSFSAVTAEYNTELFSELAESINEIPYIDNPDYSKLELDNGMIIYLSEDTELPLIELRAYIEGGISQEKKEQSGVSSLMVELMNLGTKNYNEKELIRYKELNALSISIDSDFDNYRISANSLSTEKEELIGLIAEILMNPEFNRDYFARTVNENTQFYKQQFYRDDGLLDMYFFKNIYGEHPYGYQYNYDLVLDFLNNVKPNDLEKFYQDNINPKQLVMSLSGDFKIEEMKKILEENFSDWKNNNADLKSNYIDVNQQNHGKIILVNKDDATQAKIRIGYNFYTYNFPKRTAFLMGNRIFGNNSFNSRLMENLRSEKGYVYNINSQTEYHKYGGVYYINLSVDPEKTYESIKAVKEEMNLVKSAKEPFTEEELFENVNLYNAIFPKAYKEDIAILDKIAYEVEIRGNSDQYINRFIKQYNGLEAEEVQNIFTDDLYPEIIMSVIVGPGEKIADVLEENNVDYEMIN
jgi:zinc protease